MAAQNTNATEKDPKITKKASSSPMSGSIMPVALACGDTRKKANTMARTEKQATLDALSIPICFKLPSRGLPRSYSDKC